ncbi:helix-turn-helix domain-containing protein [Coraliomargarita parva]|uniref:helix-turn-helix domain-containing protein n=1 Tax=Coraliomargarita parva TaxID=3014050 RepID=UPI0022B4190B|nr:AraC family transcriptional regulator [Coraliomargarita parva]
MNLDQWDQSKTVYRNFSGSEPDYSLSCGFLKKSGITTDIVNERYFRLTMVYVLRGRGSYEDETGLRCDLRAGDLFFRYPDRHHSSWIVPDSDWLECFVSVRAEWYRLLNRIGLLKTDKIRWHMGLQPQIPKRIEKLMRQLQNDDTPRTNNQIEFEIVGLIRELLEEHPESYEISPKHLKQLEWARLQIRNTATQDIDLESTLKGAGLSYSRLRSLFRKAYGLSPGDYRIQVRIEQACALLESSQLSIQEIADRLGYVDAFAFSKQFKQRIGHAPTQFRNRRGPAYST